MKGRNSRPAGVSPSRCLAMAGCRNTASRRWQRSREPQRPHHRDIPCWNVARCWKLPATDNHCPVDGRSRPCPCLAVIAKNAPLPHVSAVYEAPQRRSFILALKNAPEIWEVATDPDAEPVNEGHTHGYEMGMVEAIASSVGPFAGRRIRISAPLDDVLFHLRLSLPRGPLVTVPRVSSSIPMPGERSRPCRCPTRRIWDRASVGCATAPASWPHRISRRASCL